MTFDLLLDGPRVLLAIATAVLAPLALRLAGSPPRLVRALAGTGVLAAVAVALAPGPLATALVAPYALACAAAGALGAARLLARPWPATDLATHAGTIFLAGAAVWLVADRAGHALLGYPSLWVRLTAVHFHVAGAALAIVAGWAAHGRGRLGAVIAVACVAGVPLTAAGIHGPRALETAAGATMALAGTGAAWLLLTQGRLALRVAGGLLAAGMVLALGHALRAHGLAPRLGDLDVLTTMVVSHGVLDTAFALTALLALAGSAPRVQPPPVLSRLRGARTIGADFFRRAGLEREPAVPPRGLVDDLGDLGHPGLDAAAVPPAIRAFYERTADHALIVRPAWRPGFRLGARLWARVARGLGQLQLPVRAESGREGIASRIVALAEDVDGRRAPRAWIRTYRDGRALYVAAYATHRRGDRAYMNIAFPLPGGTLASVLRMDGAGRGVEVSTRRGGDCGIWLVLGPLGLRLPMSESIAVWTADDPDAPADLRAWAAGHTTIARHRLWLLGVHYLTLDYAMRPAADATLAP